MPSIFLSHPCLCTVCFVSLPVYKLAEQYTKEQQDTGAIAGETSDLETKVPESTVQTTPSKDSLPLSLIDGNEMIIQDSFPEEVNLDDAVQQDRIIEERDDSQKSATG